jgi:hypothetical protein
MWYYKSNIIKVILKNLYNKSYIIKVIVITRTASAVNNLSITHYNSHFVPIELFSADALRVRPMLQLTFFRKINLRGKLVAGLRHQFA